MLRRVLRGENLFVAFLLILVVLYVADTVRGGMDMDNVIFVLPVGALAVVLAFAVLWAQNRPRAPVREPRAEDAPPARRIDLRDPATRGVLLLALFGLYVLLMDVAPFDVASWLFMLGALLLLGERRPAFLALYPLLFGFLIAYAFRLLLPYPMDTLL